MNDEVWSTNIDYAGLSVLLEEVTEDSATFTRENTNRDDLDMSLTIPFYQWELWGKPTVLILQVAPRNPQAPDDDEPCDGGLENRLERVEHELAAIRREAYAQRLRP
jgi:hypothetical protein